MIALQETWLEKDREKDWLGRLDKKYVWVAKAASRESKRGRAKGGVLVGIKKEMNMSRAYEWEYGVIVEGVWVDKARRIDIIVTYNNGKAREMVKELRDRVEELVGKGGGVIVVGDFNARIGKWQVSEEGELVERRMSEDITNYEGRKLLDFCEEVGGTIKNGDTKGDWEGKPTYVGGEGSSVLDLVIEIENEKGDIINELIVKPRIESDHLPVEIYLGKGRITRENKKSKIKNKIKKK